MKERNCGRGRSALSEWGQVANSAGAAASGQSTRRGTISMRPTKFSAETTISPCFAKPIVTVKSAITESSGSFSPESASSPVGRSIAKTNAFSSRRKRLISRAEVRIGSRRNDFAPVPSKPSRIMVCGALSIVSANLGVATRNAFSFFCVSSLQFSSANGKRMSIFHPIRCNCSAATSASPPLRSEEHTSELQSHLNLVCRLLLEKKKPESLHMTHIVVRFYCLFFFLMIRRPPRSTLFPYTRSSDLQLGSRNAQRLQFLLCQLAAIFFRERQTNVDLPSDSLQLFCRDERVAAVEIGRAHV